MRRLNPDILTTTRTRMRSNDWTRSSGKRALPFGSSLNRSPLNGSPLSRSPRITPPVRRGAVLIMVVAVLGILFVAGAALLSVVTFSTKSLDAARIEREDRDAVNALADAVAQKLADAFLSGDGVPLAIPSNLVMHKPGLPNAACDATSDCVLTLPTVAEVPGVNLLDVTEPIEIKGGSPQECELRLTSNVLAALESRTLNSPAVWNNTNVPGAKTDQFAEVLSLKVHAPEARKMFGGAYSAGAVPFVRGSNDQPQWQFYNDSDGDGVLDSVEVTIPLSLLPPDLYRSLAGRLRASNYPGDPDRLTLSLRVVPHGAMVDLNASHPYMKRVALGYSYAAGLGGEPSNAELFAGAPFQPESNEWALRNRGVLFPPSLPPSRLLANAYRAPKLLEPLVTQSGTAMFGVNGVVAAELADPTKRLWWRFRPTDDTSNNLDDLSVWRDLMNPDNAGNTSAPYYDVSHNVTTMSNDDLLMPSFADPATGSDPLARMRLKEQKINAPLKYDPAASLFAINHHPMFVDGTGDPRLGRMKVSLPYLDLMKASPQGGLPRVTRTVQDAFQLLLAQRPEYDFNVNGALDDQLPVERARAVSAAMLAANLIDYADSGPNEPPTPVVVVDTNGAPVLGASGEPLVAYGFEQQPFITEIYTKVTTSSFPLVSKGLSVFAVELYNPYSRNISLEGYKLVDLAIEDSSLLDTMQEMRDELTFGLLPRFDVTFSSSDVIPAGSFMVVCGYTTACPDDNGKAETADAGDVAIDADSVIALKRTVRNPVTNSDVDIIVDQMAVNNTDTASIRQGPAPQNPPVSDPDFGRIGSNPGDVVEVSLQRDMKPNFWRFVVPKATKLFNAGEHTPGTFNHDEAMDESIFPVHLDLANSAAFASAFPTTGSLLLLSRMAHIYDATPIDSASPPQDASVISPFNRVSPLLLGKFKDRMNNERERNILGQYDQIDNGRLPVFDVSPNVDEPRERPALVLERGRSEGFDALPWGQLVFEYFTSVPYEVHPPVGFGDPIKPLYDMTQPPRNRVFPTVDQDGLRVRGRLNVNAAPWKVLASLPMLDPAEYLPAGYVSDLTTGLGGAPRATLGETLAKGIVAYREGRASWEGVTLDTGPYDRDRNPYGDGANADKYRPRRGYGFLTLGELLNVRHPGVNAVNVRMDAGAVDDELTPADPQARFEHAVANLVALDEWATTRSHVFTVYGVIRGAHWELSAPPPAVSQADYDKMVRSFREADQKAIRFQTTIDRLPMLFGARQPVRIGSMTLGGYADERDE